MKILAGLLLILCTSFANADIQVVSEVLDVDVTHSTLVDVNLNNVTPQQAFDAVCHFAKIPTRVDVWNPDKNKRISIVLRKAPFAEALLKVARESELTLSRFNGYCDYQTLPLPKPGTPSGTAENWIYGPLQTDGAFCGVLERVELTRTLSLANPNNISLYMQIRMATVPEPQVTIYSFCPWLTVPNVVDEKNHPLKDTVADNTQRVRHPSDNIHSVVGLPQVPADVGHELKIVTTQRCLEIVKKFRRIEIADDDLIGGTSFITDGMTVQLQRPKNLRDFGMEYRLKIHFDPTAKDVPDKALVEDGSMCEMIDDNGQLMRTLWRNSESNNDGSLNLISRFCPMPQDGKTQPDRLILFLPLAGGEVDPTFNFEHIPLEPPEK